MKKSLLLCREGAGALRLLEIPKGLFWPWGFGLEHKSGPFASELVDVAFRNFTRTVEDTTNLVLVWMITKQHAGCPAGKEKQSRSTQTESRSHLVLLLWISHILSDYQIKEQKLWKKIFPQQEGGIITWIYKPAICKQIWYLMMSDISKPEMENVHFNFLYLRKFCVKVVCLCVVCVEKICIWNPLVLWKRDLIPLVCFDSQGVSQNCRGTKLRVAVNPHHYLLM